jgi:replicative DNA helicase
LKNLELSLLKLIIQNNDLSIPEKYFSSERIELYRILKKYYEKYSKFPNDESFVEFIKDDDIEDKIVESFIEIQLADDLDRELLIEKIHEQYLLRKFSSEIRDFEKRVNSGKAVTSSLEELVTNLLTVESNEKINKGYAYETVKERWKEYKQKEEETEKFPSYHIKCLDKNIMGRKKGTVVCYVASPGTGKTTICFNIAYNLARFEGDDIMFITGELPKKDIEIILDSRDTLIDSILIRTGGLSRKMKERYKEALKEQQKRKDKFYIVEAPEYFTTEHIITWLMQYQKTYGKFPDAIFIDYLWLMDTTKKYSNTPEKLGMIMYQLRHIIAKKFNICVHTSTQESRGGQLKKSEGKIRDMESIGESNKIAPHAHVIIFLDDFKNSKDLELKNKLRLSCVKNTLGPTFIEDIWYLKEYSYIGDDNFGLVTVPIKKDNPKKKEKKEEEEEISEEEDFKFEDI